MQQKTIVNKPFRIGIAGYMGVGKSTCTNFLAEAFAPDIEIVAADSEAKRLMQSDPAIIRTLAESFGSSVFSNETLNFAALGEAAFSTVSNLLQFNSIVHPNVVAFILQRIEQSHKKYCLCDAALIPLWHIENQFDMLIWISSAPEIRLTRLTAKIRQPEALLRKRMEIQEAIMQEPAHAPWHCILNNGGCVDSVPMLLKPLIAEILAASIT